VRETRRFRAAGYCAAGLGWAALLWGCLGGSDGVENPKLELEFRPEDGSAVLVGRMRIYGSDRNPVRDSIPVLEKAFPGRPLISVTAREMDSALRSDLARRGRNADLGDTVLAFHVTATSGERETFLIGFRYRSGEKRGFARGAPEAPISSLRFGDYRETSSLPKAVVAFPGKVGDIGAVLGIDYVYIPGSPYYSSVAGDQSFVLPRLAEGIHALAGVNADVDSAYLAADSLQTADSAFTGKNWDAITFIRE
jgi:hypothetical protein